MKPINISTVCPHCGKQLPPPPSLGKAEDVRSELAAEAARAAKAAYCPYSKFQVGAAVMSEDGRIFTGCNVENASYGLTVCAERNAVFTAVAAGARKIKALALAAGKPNEVVTPCGACRQVLSEFCAPETPVYCADSEGKITLETTVGELLPGAFTL